MEIRVHYNLVNGSSINSDWKQGYREEAESAIADGLPSMSELAYIQIVCNGRIRIIVATAVTDFYIEERDETEVAF